MRAIRARLAGSTYKTPAQGAATSVWCATSPRLDGMGGVYCEDVDVAVAVAAEATSLSGVRPWAIDPVAPERPTDTDGDGMPDAGETKYGLNPNSAADATGDFDHTGYTNIEKYINGLIDGSYP